MYINYLPDRADLGFETVKELKEIEKLDKFLINYSTSKNRKGKKITIVFFSKKTISLIAGFILLTKPWKVEKEGFFTIGNNGLYSSYIYNSNKLEKNISLPNSHLNSNFINYIVNLKGGKSDQEMLENLSKCMVAKAKNRFEVSSINKIVIACCYNKLQPMSLDLLLFYLAAKENNTTDCSEMLPTRQKVIQHQLFGKIRKIQEHSPKFIDPPG
jgi:hypothetical protein